MDLAQFKTIYKVNLLTVCRNLALILVIHLILLYSLPLSYELINSFVIALLITISIIFLFKEKEPVESPKLEPVDYRNNVMFKTYPSQIDPLNLNYKVYLMDFEEYDNSILIDQINEANQKIIERIEESEEKMYDITYMLQKSIYEKIQILEVKQHSKDNRKFEKEIACILYAVWITPITFVVTNLIN